MHEQAIERAKGRFGKLLKDQLERIERMRAGEDWVDYSRLKPIIVGVCWGDGIGPYISQQTQRVLEFLLKPELESGKIVFRTIEGLTIENRAKHNKAIPDDVLEEIKQCHVLLKAPTTTPRKGDQWPNIESANVAMRRALDLFANVRPVRVPEQGIDWTFFRENTEGAYVLGSKGINVTDDLAVDFVVTTSQGSDRIIRLAFDYARRNGINKVTVVTKANVMKTTDGKFLDAARAIAAEYPEVQWDDWYIDIMTAKLLDPKRRTEFRVLVLPNLYGDILSDLCAGLVGGLGVAPGANMGEEIALFEAIHGSAPKYAGLNKVNPTALILSGVLMLRHLGEKEAADRVERAVAAVIAEGRSVTYDLKPNRDDPTAVGTSEMANAIIAKMEGR